MDFSLILFLFISISVPVVTGLQCYQTGSLDTSYKPLFRDATVCASSTQCFKQVVSNDKNGNEKGIYYGCAGMSQCSEISSGKCKSQNGVNTCCCEGDLCNSSGFYSLFPAVAVVPIVKMFC